MPEVKSRNVVVVLEVSMAVHGFEDGDDERLRDDVAAVLGAVTGNVGWSSAGEVQPEVMVEVFED